MAISRTITITDPEWILFIKVIKGTGASSGRTVYASICRDDFKDIRFFNGANALRHSIRSVEYGVQAIIAVEIHATVLPPSITMRIEYNNGLSNDASDDSIFITSDKFDAPTANKFFYPLRGNGLGNWLNGPTVIYNATLNRTTVGQRGGVEVSAGNVCSLTNHAFVTQYHHDTNRWGPTYKIGTNPFPNQAESIPTLIQTPNGYYHAFLCSGYSNGVEYFRSTNPNDVSAWTSKGRIFTTGMGVRKFAECMTAIPLSNGDIFIMGVSSTAGTENDREVFWWKSTDNGDTWSAPTLLLSSDAGTKWPWLGGQRYNPANNSIYITWNVYYGGSTYHGDLYFARLSLTDMHLYAADGTDLGTSEAVDSAACLVHASAAHPGQIYFLCIEQAHWDENNRPWLLFVEGNDAGPRYAYITRWDGAAWTAPQQIASAPTTATLVFATPTFYINTSSDVELYLPDVNGLDMYPWAYDGVNAVRGAKIASGNTALNVGGRPTLSGEYLNQPEIPIPFHPDLKLFFSAAAVGNNHTHPHVGFAWGASGLQGPSAELDSAKWNQWGLMKYWFVKDSKLYVGCNMDGTAASRGGLLGIAETVMQNKQFRALAALFQNATVIADTTYIGMGKTATAKYQWWNLGDPDRTRVHALNYLSGSDLEFIADQAGPGTAQTEFHIAADADGILEAWLDDGAKATGTKQNVNSMYMVLGAQYDNGHIQADSVEVLKYADVNTVYGAWSVEIMGGFPALNRMRRARRAA